MTTPTVPAATPRWLDPNTRDDILRRNLDDDTPLVARMRDLAYLIEVATRAQSALDAANSAK